MEGCYGHGYSRWGIVQVSRPCAACWTGGVLASSVRSSRGNLDREDVTEDVATRHGLRLCRRTYVALASSGLRTLSVALHDRTMLCHDSPLTNNNHPSFSRLHSFIAPPAAPQ